MYELVNAIKDVSILLSPFIPETSEKIAKVFGFDISLKGLKSELKAGKIKKSEILFKKIDVNVKGNNPVSKVHEAWRNKNVIGDNKQTNEKINKTEGIEGIMSTIDFKDWEKIELRVGKIEKVEDIEGADKLYKLSIGIGHEKRVVCAGIKKFYKKDELKGKKVVLFVNLAPRMMRGIESQGMILAAVSDDESKVVLIEPDKDIKEGSRIR